MNISHSFRYIDDFGKLLIFESFDIFNDHSSIKSYGNSGRSF